MLPNTPQCAADVNRPQQPCGEGTTVWGLVLSDDQSEQRSDQV